MNEKRLVPKRRFKEFQNTEAWEQRKITNLAKINIGLVTTMTKHYTDDGTLLIRNSDIKDNRFEFDKAPIHLERSFADKNYSRKHLIGDVITVHTGDVGTSAVITENEVNSIGFATIVTRPNPEIIDSNYLSSFLNTDIHKNWAASVSTGDGRTNYNLGDYYELIVPVPKLEEQRKIAQYVEHFNNLITLHQRKLEKTKALKSAYLAEMFPAEGERVPKRRFAGFTGEWEDKNLEDVVIIIMGQSPSSASYTTNPTDYILVQGNADLKNHKVVPRVWTTQITKLAEKGDLILSVRAPVGDVGKTDFDIVLGRGVAGLKGNEFIYQLLIKMKKDDYWGQLSTGSTFDSINSNDIKQARVLIPSMSEQIKIGEFFNKLDDSIANQQQKLNKFKAMKQAYLQEMFV